MDRSEIEREVRRLAPWYYLWELGGVRTDITPPCDDQGHREVSCPPIYDGFWRGRRVLDVACNEGAYGLGALGHGARELVGFDSRPSNIEKARFVARVRGHDHATFEVASCDSWIAAHGDERFDIVMLCGILYHLEDPARTIADFSRVTNDWIYVTCCVHGDAAEGYTWTSETENVAASDGAKDSLMPNNADTLVTEFGRHGFVPVHVEEVAKADFWDGVNLLLRNCSGVAARSEPLAGAGRDVRVHLAPEAGADGALDVHVAVSNRLGVPLDVDVATTAVDGAGRTHDLGAERLALPARSVTPGIPASASVYRRTSLPAGPARPGELQVRVREGDRLRGGARLVLG